MQKIINELITFSIKGADVYRWKNATWLIFTNDTRWVVELTDEGTLWYNYRFFNDIFKYISMDAGRQTEEYIIRWANDFFYKDCAHRTVAYPMDKARNETPNVLENGIKNLSSTRTLGEHYIDMVVTSGIKDTQGRGKNHGDEFEWHTRAVIGNGVKEVGGLNSKAEFNVRNVMNYGVKEVNDSSAVHRQNRAQNEMDRMIKNVKPNRVTIVGEKMDRFYYDNDCTANNTEIFRIVEEGVKKVKPNIEYSNQSGVYHPDCLANCVKIEKVIEEGVKNIYPDTIPGDYDWRSEFDTVKVIDNGIKVIPLPTKEGINGYSDYYDSKGWDGKSHTDNVNDAIEGGVKLIPLPDQSGELRGYSDYYSTKEDRTKPHTEYVKEAVNGGVKL
jgi:hypothetical protein